MSSWLLPFLYLLKFILGGPKLNYHTPGPSTPVLYMQTLTSCGHADKLDRVKRIWYLLPMWAAKVQASLRIRAVSPEPPLLAHTSSESRGNFRQKARSLAPLNGWACAIKICHDGMLEDTNSLDGAQLCLRKPRVLVAFVQILLACLPSKIVSNCYAKILDIFYISKDSSL